MRGLSILFFAALLVVFVAGCSDDDCPTCPKNETPSLDYVGSVACGASGCHESKYQMFVESGHPFKLTAVTGNQGPVFPFDDEHLSGGVVSRDGPAPGNAWSSFAYVVGGYGWKARFIQPDGNVYTTGAQAQLNLWGNGPEWVPYRQGTTTLYDYSCFKCHTTGASSEGSWPQGTTGFGTFVFGGVQCEQCHGPGAQHASDPDLFAMRVDPSSDLCGECHTRDPQRRVVVKGGYVDHHEQYDELIHSPHAAVGCNACHDPHASVVYDDVALGSGVTTQCVTCHTGYDTNLNHNGVPECVDCHMPKTGKSARVTSNPYVADVGSHTFKIRTDAVGKSAMWTSDGLFLALDEFGRARITLDFACYSCHKDDQGVGGEYSQKSLAELSARAQDIHAGTQLTSK